MCEKERRKREKHTWAFLGRQMLRWSTKIRRRVSKFIKRERKEKVRTRSGGGELEPIGGGVVDRGINREN